MSSPEVQNLELGVVDPRKASESVSLTYLFCVLKGLHRSPGIITEPVNASVNGLLSVSDIHCLITPDGCIGIPLLAALKQSIPVIAVKGNKSIMKNDLSKLPFKKGQLFYADNYLEAVGIMNSLKAGVDPDTVLRPIAPASFSLA
jgi:hypothetical protein